MNNFAKKIIIIAGPTGVGKTDASLELAKEIGGEIISADSMQIYRGMDIGTAKISENEMEGVVHHLIDIVSPTDKFTVYDFQKLSTDKIKEIIGRGKVPIVVGGTGLYINTLLFEMDFNKVQMDEAYRRTLWSLYEENGEDFLYQKLIEAAPHTKIEKGNIKRIIRALEIIRSTGKLGDFDTIQPRRDIESQLFIFNRDRAELYQRINRRVEKMVEDGLVSEVKNLYDNGVDDRYQSMKAIGYYQIIQHFQGLCTLNEAVEKIKQESRRYAKRQITWFKRYQQAHWFDMTNCDEDEIIDKIKKKIYANFL